ncbi:hypothetical protein C7974DRAFT_208568 [Boeremia exigua]|uniref:uncharacterized protein n=1 Tax=Boeremia exigua TaxID=749465 RepID=UPI001E8CE9ED|nr:uncharacterized protein C7974DRAFT_208568 [Boeremia exigua]KAH6625849.1 hypothetical protein C7974DRAFT_208568 [Boeremia exigua]
MKSTLAISTLIAGALAGAIPGDVHTDIHRRNAAPVCAFEAQGLAFDDSNAWNTTPAKRDLNVKTWNPPSNLKKGLDAVWKHQVDTYSNALGFKNYGYDQLIAGKGKINYCVRWEGDAKVTAAQRAKVQAALKKQYNKWISVLAGFDGFPYKTVDVNVVGWAVKNKSQLEGDVSGITVYTDKDSEGVPQCAESCGRFFHQDNNYAACKAGAAKHYDHSLWLTPGMQGGAGGDWGQRVGQEYFMQNVDAENIHIYLHEVGHTYALDDFYDWTPEGVTNFVMLAGSAMEITEFDAWMARDWWRHLKSRYSL